MNISGVGKLMGRSDGIYDGHAHVFRRSLPMMDNRRYTPDYDASLDEYAALLVENQLGGGLLVQPSFLGSDNSFLLESLDRAEKEYPTLTFKGVAVVEPHATPEELKRLYDSGIVGLRLNFFMCESAFVFEHWRSVLETADKLGWHIEIHARGPFLPKIFPNLLSTNQTVVVDHFGLPEPSGKNECVGFDAISNAPEGRVLVKISAPYRLKNYGVEGNSSKIVQPALDRLLEALGPENLIWGSDWPHTQHENQFCFAQSLEYRKYSVSALG